jgi:hypothetical protein
MLVMLLVAMLSAAADEVSLMQPGKEKLGWSFDQGQEFPGAQGRVSIDDTQKHDGEDSLHLEGDFSAGGAYVRASTPVAAINPGEVTMWLKSPDTDRVTLRLLDATGQCHQLTFKWRTGADWQNFDFNLRQFFAKTEEPTGTPVIRYESWGGAADQKWHGPLKSLDILISPTDAKKIVDLWISGVALRRDTSGTGPASSGSAGIVRLSFATAQLGNLLYPHDPRLFQVSVEATSPLEPRQLALAYVVRDYGGAEQTTPGTVALIPAATRLHGHFNYTAAIDLARAPLEVGRYYELHATVPQLQGDPYHDHTEFALLPEAEANAFSPSQIPFSSRDWDNRLPEYFLLSHRLGIRICGVWSGWDADRPGQPYAPGIDFCARLGMGVIASTPLHTIEEHLPGYEKYTEPALRTGTRSLIEKYGKTVQPFILSLGNEPHETGDRVREDIKAYEAVYDEAKKTDATIMVLGTSVGPEEEFFKDGLGAFCDAYDFHAYEEAPHVTAIFQKYHQLFEKYGHAKPIWSTELGLESQGVSRRDVAADMIRKFALFFTGGGVNLSWFDLLYPDPDGTAADSSGAAHNVFDSRYDHYAPKLTAVIYYDLINTILDKKFIATRSYDDLHIFLFRDRADRSLIIGWKDAGRRDLFLPLPGVHEVGLIRVDSRRRTLDADGQGVTLSFGTDPVLISFSSEAPLPDALGKPVAWFSSIPAALAQGAPTVVGLSRGGLSSATLHLIAPPFWQVKETKGNTGISFTLTPPPVTAIHDADLIGLISNARGEADGEIDVRLPIENRSDLGKVKAAR